MLTHGLNFLFAVHERIEDGANFSFNYNVLLLVSSVIAGLGLVSDNSTAIIASMLVSPIMGPVVGLACASRIMMCLLLLLSSRVPVLINLASKHYRWNDHSRLETR